MWTSLVLLGAIARAQDAPPQAETRAIERSADGALLAGLLGFLGGLGLAAGGAWWIWGRTPPPSLSPASLPPPLEWPEELPLPVGRQLWLAPDEPARDRALRWLVERLSRRGPVILLAGAEPPGALPGALRPAGDPASAEGLEDLTRALVGDPSILVAGEIPALDELLRASPAPVIAVLTRPREGGPAPAVTLTDSGGALCAGGVPVIGG